MKKQYPEQVYLMMGLHPTSVKENYKEELKHVTEMLKKLDLPTLKQCRKMYKVTMVFKIKNNLIDIPAELYLPTPTRPNKRHPNNIIIPRSNKTIHLDSFFPSSIRLWNSLPPHATPCRADWSPLTLPRCLQGS